MNAGGFDVVIGNPPYLNVELISTKHKSYYSKTFSTFYKRSDIFSLFFEHSITRMTKKGLVSFIVPSQLLNNLSYKKLRDLILDNKFLKEVCYVGNKVFSDATNDVVIVILRKSLHDKVKLINALDFNKPIIQEVNFDYFKKFNNQISISSSNESNSIFDKIYDKKLETLKSNYEVFQGIVTGNNSVYIFDGDTKTKGLKIERELLKPILHGRDFSKWIIENKQRKILYLNKETEIEKYKNAFLWVSQFKSELSKRRECKKGVIPWFSLQWPRDKYKLDFVPKIIVQSIRNERLKTRVVATMDRENFYGTQGLNFIISRDSKSSLYVLLSILNSKLINFLFQTKLLNLAIKAEYLKDIHLPKIDCDNKNELETSCITMLDRFEDYNNKNQLFLSRITSNFPIDKPSKKLKEFYNYDFKTFLSELKKKKVSLSLKQQEEWEEYFSEYKKAINSLQETIDKTDREINKIVYELYGLTDEEIKIVEETL